MDSDNGDEAGDRIHAAVDRIYAGEIAIAAIARGEVVDPEVLARAADGLADLLGPGVTGPTWTQVDVDRVRRLRDMLTGDAPSPEARALAAEHVPVFLGETGDDTRARQTRRMEHILAERTLKIEVDGLPDATLRVVVGQPVMVSDDEYRTDIELHGPEPGSVLRRYMIGSDAWQATCLAFWIIPVMVHTRCNTHARITHDGEEDWSCVKAPLPLP